jgi:hypothetical protein
LDFAMISSHQQADVCLRSASSHWERRLQRWRTD